MRICTISGHIVVLIMNDDIEWLNQSEVEYCFSRYHEACNTDPVDHKMQGELRRACDLNMKHHIVNDDGQF